MNVLRKESLFWSEAFGVAGSAMPLILTRTLMVGAFALLITIVDLNAALPDLGIDVTPFEVAGGALSLLLVLRTNAGYDRWWEGRRLWGGIVNQCRNLAIASLSYGPDDPVWRDRIVRRAVAFAHVTRRSLRGERPAAELVALLGTDEAGHISSADHMPSAVACLVGESVRDARDRLGLDGFALLRVDQERATLIDHVGGCERILKTPLPLAYRIEIRRFLILFLASLPFALVDKIEWLTPVVSLLVALPLLAIDKIGTELECPFSTESLNHLPLDEICATIEQNLFSLLAADAAFKVGLDDREPNHSAPETI